MRFVVLSLLAVPALLAAQTPTPDVSGYKVISLQEALEMAKKNSTQAIQAQNAIETAEIAVRSAKAQFLPSVSVSAGQSQSTGRERHQAP